MATIVILLKSFDALYTVLTISNSVPFPKSLRPVCMHAHAHTHTHTHAHFCASLQFLSTIYIHELFSDLDLNFPPL